MVANMNKRHILRKGSQLDVGSFRCGYLYGINHPMLQENTSERFLLYLYLSLLSKKYFPFQNHPVPSAEWGSTAHWRGSPMVQKTQGKVILQESSYCKSHDFFAQAWASRIFKTSNVQDDVGQRSDWSALVGQKIFVHLIGHFVSFKFKKIYFPAPGTVGPPLRASLRSVPCGVLGVRGREGEGRGRD